MKKLFNLNYILVCVLFIVVISSCKQLISINPPKSQLVTKLVYENDESATAAILDIYTWFENHRLEANIMPNISLYTDEVYSTTEDEQAMEYYSNTIPPDDYSNANIWKYLYFIIYESNSVLSNLANSAKVSKKAKEQLTGEAKFLRAFAYYFLINLYGDVPLVLSTDVTVSSVLPRTSMGKIYQQIIKDLKEAEIDLTPEYPTQGKTRANKWCAAALLARVYLYVQNWPEAEAQSSAVIESRKYSLGSLNKVFVKNSDEAILQCWNQNGYTHAGTQFIPSASGEMPRFAIDSGLLASFETGDKRKMVWLNSVSVSGKTYYYPYKYKVRTTASGDEAEYAMLLRLGEQYLIRAEARAHENNLSGAIDDLSIIRVRAGLKGLPVNLSKANILSAVAHERRVELFTEWGHRFFDLKRTGKINEVLGTLKPNWEPTAQLYPFPQNELDNNPYLTQNEGY